PPLDVRADGLRHPRLATRRVPTGLGSEGGQLLGGELAPLAGLEALHGEWAVAAALQAADRVADLGEHALHLGLAALVEDPRDASPAHAAGARRSGAAVVEIDAALECGERRPRRVAVD